MGRGRSKAGSGGGVQLGGLQSDLEKEEKLADLEEQLANAKGIFAKARISDQIEMVKSDFQGTLEEYREQKRREQEERVEKARQEAEKKRQEQEAEKKRQEQERAEQLQNELRTQPKNKVEQYKIIQENNPMNDDYHVGIRKPSDIKTWQEVINSADDGDSFEWGDFTLQDAKKALKDGKIRIYSSYKIDQGIFVSTSKVQAEQYAGGTGKKVYSKIVPLEDVAWINGDEGQYANLKKKRK